MTEQDGGINMQVVYQAAGRIMLEAELRRIRADQEIRALRNQLNEAIDLMSKMSANPAPDVVTVPDAALGRSEDGEGTRDPD